MIVKYKEKFYDGVYEFFEESEENRKEIQKIYKISDKDMRALEDEDSDSVDLVDLTDSDTEVITEVYKRRPGYYLVEYDEEADGIRVLELKIKEVKK